VRATLAPRLDPTRCRCPDVAPCFQACPWGIDPRTMRPRDGCTTCLACVERCPSQALSVSFRRSRLNAHPEER
jgi:ferredoxin